MTATVQRSTFARDTSRFMQAYAKDFAAGAFATPTGKEIDEHPGLVVTWRAPDGALDTVLAHKRLTRDSSRRDFTGAPIPLPAGATVATHIARRPGAPVPDLAAYDYVQAYVEDRELTRALREQRRNIVGVRVTSASELIAVWGRRGADRRRYALHDLATVTEVPGPHVDPAVLREVAGATGWHDDYPYYSDGSWSALSLRGFWRDDPTRGVKPAEMPKSWKADHPADLARPCEWTVLADAMPAVRRLVESVPWWAGLERVRLLRMAGRGGRGGKLDRHTDITDRAAGTRDGQIVRFHVPLVTHPDIKLHAWELNGTHTATHLRAGHCYYLDARKPHAVTNPTGVDRIHLVADVVADEEVREVIASSYGEMTG